MRLGLKNRNHVPPGGFNYLDEDTGKEININGFNSCWELAARHRASNHLPPLPDLAGIIEEQTAERLANEGHGAWTEYREASFVPTGKGFWANLNDVVRGTLTIGASVLKGRPKVSQAEADRRAAICVNCEFNLDPVDCRSCNMSIVKDTVQQVVGNSATSYDSQLKSCYWCGCFNKAAVWFPLDLLRQFQSKRTNESLPSFCWKKST